MQNTHEREKTSQNDSNFFEVAILEKHFALERQLVFLKRQRSFVAIMGLDRRPYLYIE